MNAEPRPAPSGIAARLRLAVEWKRMQIRAWWMRTLRRAAGRAFIRVRWPWPLRKPWQRDRLRIASFGGGVGDEMMCTPIFREIKRRNPRCRVTFLSRHPELHRGNPHLDEVEPFSPDHAGGVYWLTYGPIHPPPRPLIELMAECIGLDFMSRELDPPALEPPPEIRRAIDAIPAPRIVIQPLSSRWTPNKNWPAESWAELVAMLAAKFDVIEVGGETLFPGREFGPRFHNFCGRTDLAGFAHAIRSAAVFIGPVSSGMHLANAFKVPAVVIYGGYESPAGHDYPNTVALYSPVPCAPCWLGSDCPYDRKCLRMIEPKRVFEIVCGMVAPQS